VLKKLMPAVPVIIFTARNYRIIEKLPTIRKVLAWKARTGMPSRHLILLELVLTPRNQEHAGACS
jgi:hypothetical protein